MEIRQAIDLYLKAKAFNDEEFAKKLKNPFKNLDECVTYITYCMYCKVKDAGEKERVGVCIPSDDEIFALAEHYYEDADLKVDGKDLLSVRIVSMAATSFTEEEKAQMRQEAITKYQNDVIAQQKRKDEERKAKAKAAKEKKPAQPVLVPDTQEEGEEPKSEEPKKGECVQMDLFG